MSIRVVIDFPKPKKPRKPKTVYLYEQEAQSLKGRYFVYENRLMYVDRIEKDTKKKCWVCWVITTRAKHNVNYQVTGLYDQEAGGSWTCYYPLDILKNAKEITKEQYQTGRNIVISAALQLEEYINRLNIGL